MFEHYRRNPPGFEMISKKDGTCRVDRGGCGKPIETGKTRITLVQEEPYPVWLCSDCASLQLKPFSMWEDPKFTIPLLHKDTGKQIRYATAEEAQGLVVKGKKFRNKDVYFKDDRAPIGQVIEGDIITSFPELEIKTHAGMVQPPPPCYRLSKDGTKYEPKFGPHFNPSQYQAAIREEFLKGKSHLVIDAKAGSGKTSTLEWVLCTAMRGRTDKAIFLAYNRHIKRELESRLKGLPGLSISTLNGLGTATIYRTLLKGKPLCDFKKNGKKINIIAETMFPPEPADETPAAKALAERNSQIADALVALVNKIRCTLATPDQYEDLIVRYKIDITDDLKPQMLAAVPEVLRQDIEQAKANVLDFTDQVYIPNALNLTPPQYTTIFVDETQDLNKAQTELMLKASGKNGRVICVGDPFQSIYAFNGADVDSMPNIIKRLSNTPRGCKVLPLSISYRCPKKVIELAQEIVPDIFAAPNAPDGIIDDLPYKKFVNSLSNEDAEPGPKGEVRTMVLCRMNAPLVGPVYSLIRRGIKATILGRDIGSNLVSLIHKINGDKKDKKTKKMVIKSEDILAFTSKLQAYAYKEKQKLVAAKKETDEFEDRIACIVALLEGANSVSEVLHKIETIFSDEDEKHTGIIFSSVHKSKGLEALHIFLLGPELFPSPKATEPWEIQQEKNLEYVAYTRAMYHLTLVNLPKKGDTSEGEEGVGYERPTAPTTEALPPETPAEMGLYSLWWDPAFTKPLIYQNKPLVANSQKQAEKLATKIEGAKNKKVYIKPPMQTNPLSWGWSWYN